MATVRVDVKADTVGELLLELVQGVASDSAFTSPSRLSERFAVDAPQRVTVTQNPGGLRRRDGPSRGVLAVAGRHM
jgi:hypothetical protein